jgi:hypothetical protein
MALEDDGKFEEAEKEFVKAQKPREAVLMWVALKAMSCRWKKGKELSRVLMDEENQICWHTLNVINEDVMFQEEADWRQDPF